MKRQYVIAGHVIFWLLFLLKEYSSDRPYLNRYPALGELIYIISYSLIILTAFYGGYGLIYRHIIRPWPRQGWIGLVHILTTLCLVVLARYIVEFGFLKPVYGYDNYSLNKNFTWSWFIENAARYYWSWILYGVLYGFAENYVQQQLKAKEFMRSEISLLRAQVNPHFLFNALNDIYALTLTKPNEAPTAVMKLSELLRYMLYSSQSSSVPLVDEVNYLKSYIELEQIGQAGRANIQAAFTGHLNGQRIAPMLLIPFVENAFKHGVLFEEDQPITVALDVQPDRLVFQCRNTKRNGQKDKTGGIGLANLRRRLDLEYPGRYQLRINDTDEVFAVDFNVTF